MVCRQQLAPGKLPRVMIVDNTMASFSDVPVAPSRFGDVVFV